MTDFPTVGVVVVNYRTPAQTRRSLISLAASDWPAQRLRTVLVDNGSEPGFVDTIRRDFPEVVVIEPGANLGFPAACNRGIAALEGCPLVALVNSDAVVDPSWLRELVPATEDPGVGAAVPKILLSTPFAWVTVSTTASEAPGDPRDLGVQLSGARVGGADVLAGTKLRDGFWNWEQNPSVGAFTWTAATATAVVPVPSENSDDPLVELRLSCVLGPKDVTVQIGDAKARLHVGVTPEWHTIGRAGPRVRLLNSAGTRMSRSIEAADRGFLEPDRGQFDVAGDVGGWSATAVLLTRRFLDDVGPFDERLFLYYEDVDLTWRGRLRGWRYRYVPTARVEHEHSATTGSAGALVRHLTARNRLLVSIKCAPASDAWAAVWQATADVARAALHDLVAPTLLRRGRADSTHLRNGIRLLGGVAQGTPAALAARAQIARGRKRSRAAALTGWVDDDGPPTMRLGRR